MYDPNYHKNRAEKRKLRGQCRYCDSTICANSTVSCSACLKRYNNYKKRRRVFEICRNCPNKISKRSSCLCDMCLDKNKTRIHGYVTDIDETSIARRKYASIKSSAKKRDIDLSLNISEFIDWYISQPPECYYCEIQINELKKIKRKKSIMTIDRKENSLGYTLDNICLACFRCNNMKSNFFKSNEWKEIASKYIVPRINEYHA